jgi:hypothetical protein
MRMALRLVAVLVAVSLMGNLPARGGTCDLDTAPCRNAQPLDCCSAHCHCDLSAPVQPAPNPVPARATTITGHEIAKTASLPVDAIFLGGGDYLHLRSTARADTSTPTAAGSYLLTHAFLI